MAVDLLNLPSLRVIELDDGAASGKGFVTVKAIVVGDTTHCPHCMGMRIHGHGVEERKVADTPLFGKPTKLIVQRKRFKCLDCDKTFSEPTPDLHDTRQATKRLVKFVQENGLRLTMAEVARQTGVAVDIVTGRIENPTIRSRLPRIDVLTARALAPLDKLIALAAPYLAADGTLLFLKGRGAEREVGEAEREWRFERELIPSSTDAAARIVRIWNLSPRREERS